MLISIIVPCYNEEAMIPMFYNELCSIVDSLSNYSFEIIFVDDGSHDTSLEKMRTLSANDGRVKYISFSRNFGKESAMYAGLSMACGDLVAIMDVDLQDPPSLLPRMIHYFEEGYDSVATRRVNREGEPPIRSFFARIFYKLINKMADIDIVDGARDYRLMTRRMVDSILSMREYHRFSKGIFGWVGYRTKWIEYENIERIAGESNWSFWKLFKYAIEGIVAFTTAPLRIASFSGIVFSAISFIYLFYIVLKI